MADLQSETAELLQALVRFNTVNLPGDERPAIEHLEAHLSAAGLETELLAAIERRPNLVRYPAQGGRRAVDTKPTLEPSGLEQFQIHESPFKARLANCCVID